MLSHIIEAYCSANLISCSISPGGGIEPCPPQPFTFANTFFLGIRSSAHFVFPVPEAPLLRWVAHSILMEEAVDVRLLPNHTAFSEPGLFESQLHCLSEGPGSERSEAILEKKTLREIIVRSQVAPVSQEGVKECE